MATLIQRINKPRQYLYSLLLLSTVASACYVSSAYLDYRVVAFLLLLVVSVTAVLFDILPVLVTAVMSAMTWNFFFTIAAKIWRAVKRVNRALRAHGHKPSPASTHSISGRFQIAMVPMDRETPKRPLSLRFPPRFLVRFDLRERRGAPKFHRRLCVANAKAAAVG